MVKRKGFPTLSHTQAATDTRLPILIPSPDENPSPRKRRAGQRRVLQAEPELTSTSPDKNPNFVDGPEALRASVDVEEIEDGLEGEQTGLDVEGLAKQAEEDNTPSLIADDVSTSPLSDISDAESPTKAKKSRSQLAKVIGTQFRSVDDKIGKKTAVPAAKTKKEHIEEPILLDPELEGDEEADEEEIQAAISRPPPVDSDYLPLPWQGRLGYACLCTYLRYSNPPVFSSRTCRIASILENRHPLKDPKEPPHPTKNRPDREQPASTERGQYFVQSLGLANARDIVKMLRWNDRYGIKFLRLSSEMFPFASHEEYGYKLAPFASETLAEAGEVAAELGHRLTTHPGQFTQLGSPRKEVIKNAIRDLEYHAELLSLLKLPPQQDRDAVMILHLGGVFGDKAATLDRFRANFKGLSQNIKNRLVLENDDVSWSVHDLLPVCEELNIPMVLDYHHHNIIFDASQIREGSKDIMDLYPRILATWKRRNITPKMHYSEPTPAAITGRQRRKHSPRVATLPPCPPTMDLMIEAKDKEQAVFQLMRTFKLPGYNNFSNMTPHVRKDDNKHAKVPKPKTPQQKTKKAELEEDADEIFEEVTANQVEIAGEVVGMGGPEGRVYWPPGMEHWLRPAKKAVKPKDPTEIKHKKVVTPRKKRKGERVQPNNVPDAAASTKRPPKRAKFVVEKRLNTEKTGLAASASADEMIPDAPCEPSTLVPSEKISTLFTSRKSARKQKINYAEDK